MMFSILAFLSLSLTSAAVPVVGDSLPPDTQLTSHEYIVPGNVDATPDPARTEAGPILRLKLHFDDAEVTPIDQNVDPFFGERTSPDTNLIDDYTWPKAGRYSAGGVWMPHPESPSDDWNSSLRMPPTENIACDASASLKNGRTPPERFPLVQVYSVRVSDSTTPSAKDPKVDVPMHELRMDFVGGYFKCSFIDSNPTHVWTVRELKWAMGSRLAIYLPDSSSGDAAPAPAIALDAAGLKTASGPAARSAATPQSPVTQQAAH